MDTYASMELFTLTKEYLSIMELDETLSPSLLMPLKV